MSRLGVAFAGGGTGGHLYPALAIAERLDNAQIRYIHSDRAIDVTVLEGAGVESAHRSPSPAKPLRSNPIGLARFAMAFGPSVRHARGVIRALKQECDRVVVAATGGFVCAPAARAARAERVPLIAISLDATPGKASRLVARNAARALTVYPQPDHPEWTTIGPIVRRAALAPGDAGSCRDALRLNPERPTLLIMGGSQGATSLNQLLLAEMRSPGPLAHAILEAGWQVVHQCGDKDRDELLSAYADASVPASVEPLFDPVGLAWGAADLALTRGGAGAIAEAWANRVPCVVAPYPYHKDQHQAANAQPLVDAGGAFVETDRIEPEANRGGLGQRVADLIIGADARAGMRSALAGLARPDGAAEAASLMVAF